MEHGLAIAKIPEIWKKMFWIRYNVYPVNTVLNPYGLYTKAKHITL